MGNRHMGPANEDFVKALNMVDIVYHKNKKVREALHKYFTYTSSPVYAGSPRIEAFFDLLLKMAQDIGYNNLAHSDINDYYIPAAPKQPDQPAPPEPSKS